MSFGELFDTDEERAYWFSAIARFSEAVSFSVVISGNPLYALVTLALGSASREIAGFYKLKIVPKTNENNPTPPNGGDPK